MQPDRPVFSDRSRISAIQFLGPALVVYLVIFGLSQADNVALLLGALLALYLAFTSHTRYELYRDALVIKFLAPRRQVVSVSEVEGAQLVRVPLRGETLVIRRRGRGPMLIRPSDALQFQAQLNELIGGGH